MYSPSLTGSRLLRVPTKFMQAHKARVAQRALSRLLRTKAVTPLSAKLLTSGTPIYGYVKLRKDQGEWRPYSVISFDGHKVEVRAHRRGSKTLLALEDVRLRPENVTASAQLLNRS